MFRTIVEPLAMAAFFMLLALPAVADMATPPAGFDGQWWRNPAGCEYSRAGRPGETVWFLVINTAKPGCPTYLATKTWGDVYAAAGPKM